MKIPKLLLLTLFVASCHLGLREKKNQSIRVQFVYYHPYCGGVKPTDEMLESYQKERPLSNTKLLIYYDDKKISRTSTDSAGCVNLEARRNVFFVFLDSAYLCPHLPAPSCKEYYRTPIALLNNSVKNYKIALRFACNPCEPFNGKRP